MENKTSYSLQDAQDKESQLAGYKDFDSFYRQNAKEHVYGIMKEAAELYKSKATEELRKENERLESHFMSQELQIERLKESNKELVEALKIAREFMYPGDIRRIAIDGIIQKSEGDVNKKI